MSDPEGQKGMVFERQRNITESLTQVHDDLYGSGDIQRVSPGTSSSNIAELPNNRTPYILALDNNIDSKFQGRSVDEDFAQLNTYTRIPDISMVQGIENSSYDYKGMEQGTNVDSQYTLSVRDNGSLYLDISNTYHNTPEKNAHTVTHRVSFNAQDPNLNISNIIHTNPDIDNVDQAIEYLQEEIGGLVKELAPRMSVSNGVDINLSPDFKEDLIAASPDIRAPFVSAPGEYNVPIQLPPSQTPFIQNQQNPTTEQKLEEICIKDAESIKAVQDAIDFAANMWDGPDAADTAIEAPAPERGGRGGMGGR